ncbi:MAG TPA: hypothetical protein VJK03_05110 [Candidatus Nanoarchaeia archaeon]|nr:hypothetical protein [Candidatus Nanoarchaeia archaeon]
MLDEGKAYEIIEKIMGLPDVTKIQEDINFEKDRADIKDSLKGRYFKETSEVKGRMVSCAECHKTDPVFLQGHTLLYNPEGKRMDLVLQHEYLHKLKSHPQTLNKKERQCAEDIVSFLNL